MSVSWTILKQFINKLENKAIKHSFAYLQYIWDGFCHTQLVTHGKMRLDRLDWKPYGIE